MTYEYDVFICHASEDKNNFVREFAEELQRRNYRVWYDEFSLRIGDSLRGSIDKGLEKSRYGIVVLSPNFFEKSWTQTELDGLVQKEIGGQKVILPIWHCVSREEVAKYSLTLADKLAALTSEGLNSVVNKIIDVLNSQVTEEPKKSENLPSKNNNINDLIQQIEQYLRENDGISLGKLIIHEARTLSDTVKGNIEVCPWQINPNDNIQCQQCIEYLESISEPFVKIIATIIYHDSDLRFINQIVKAITLLARTARPKGVWSNERGRFVRLYPLSLIIYTIFIIGVQEKKEALLRAILSISWNRQDEDLKNQPLTDVFIYIHGYSYSVFHSSLENNLYFAPISERIQAILIPWINGFLIEPNSAFFQAEFMMGLADLQARKSDSLP